MAKVIKGAAELAGEAVIAGAVVQPPGSMGSGSTGAGAIGKITQATVQAGDARRHADTARTSPLSGAQRGYLAVTEGRLLVMVVKVGFSQKADSILTQVRRADVAGARFEKGLLSSVVIEFRDGTEWHFSAVKIDAGKARKVVELLAA